MTIYKRIGSFILSLLLVFSMFGSTFAIQTFAATSPALSAESKTVNAGEQFTVAVSLANATTVYGGNFTLQYDSSLLTADSYEFSSIVSGHTKNCNLNYQSAGNMIRVTFSGASAVTASGALITFTFTAKENVSGSAALQFNAYKMYDENGSAITSTATGSTITIVAEPVVSPTLSVSSKTVTEGSTVSVPIVISDSEAVYGGNFTLQYDSNLLSADSYSFGSIVSGHTKNCNLDYQSAGNLIRVTFSGAEAISADGTLITLTFTAKTAGTASLQFNAYKMYDENGSSIDTITLNGTITINPDSDDIIKGNWTSAISWELNKTTGKLTLFGNGDLTGGYSSTGTPWYYSPTCNYVKSVEISDGITSVGSFEHCANLESVVLASSVKTIKAAAFRNCSKLTDIDIHSGITDIDGSAFEGCSSLSDITLPDTIEHIGSDAFYNTGYYNDSSNWTDGVLYINNCLIRMSEDYSGNFFMSNYTYVIADFAFSYCDKLTSIHLPNSIDCIPERAFLYSGLESISIPDNIKTIKREAFGSCNLSSIDFGNGIENIEYQAFAGCDLTEIILPEQIESIAEEAFIDCKSLIDITILNGDVEIGENALGYYETPTYQMLHYSDYTTIYGLNNSTAKEYAEANEITFLALDDIMSLSIYSGPEKTVYYIGDELDTSDLYLWVEYRDGSASTLCETEYTVSEFDSSTTGIKTITAYYGGFSVSFDVVVEQPSISLSANSKSLNVGETTTLIATTTPSDQSVTWTSSNTSVATVSRGNIIAKANGTAVITAKFTYNGNTYRKTCNITVGTPVVIETMGILAFPSETLYIGDQLDVDTIQIRVEYSDGTEDILTDGFTVTGFDSSSAGTKTVTVSYEGFTDTFTVTVKTPSITLSSSSKAMSVGDTSAITATTTPSGQAVTWTSSNTSVATVSGGTITGKASGSTTITAKFTYNGTTYSKTCSVTVEDVPVPPTPVSLSVSTKPTKTTYEIGESLNTSGLKLKLTYSDGSYETITSGFTTSGFSSTTAGTKTVTVKYGSLTTTFTVTVNVPEPDIDENAPQIVVESTKARAGETVSVTISLKNNPGIASLKLKVSYDASLTLTEIVYNNEIGGQFTFPQTMVSPATLNWVNATEDSEGDWTFATLTFKVSENAEAGNCPISITYDPDDVYDLTETNIEFAVVNGSIDVIEYISGDINGDSKVNNKDATRLLQYLSDWNVEVVEAALDVNGDGKVNNKDATRLLQYLSDWDVEIY